MSYVPVNKTSLLFTRLSWLAFFVSFVCSFRAVTSISMIAILLAGMFENRSSLRLFFRAMFSNPFTIACLIFFLLQLVAMLYTRDIHEGWKNTRIKTGLVFVPLAAGSVFLLSKELRKKLFRDFCFVLALASFYCICMAVLAYQKTGDNQVFFYHALVSPFSQHAVYFSIFVFVALSYLLESSRKHELIYHKLFHAGLILYFSIFLFLLSSKLVIIFYGLYLLYYFYTVLKRNTKKTVLLFVVFFVFIGTSGTLLVLKNPVSNRFYEILDGDMSLVSQDKFDRADYFNGLQFRLLQWKFVTAVLEKNHCWLMGTSPGDAQSFLDNEYITRNMYIGDPATGSRGLLGYNTHNQFLESLLQTGVIGLGFFLLVTGGLIWLALAGKDRLNRAVILLLIAYSLSESVFETQYGILLYTLFPLFTWPGKKINPVSK